MYLDDPSRRRRELVVTAVLAVLAGAGIFFFFLLATGGLVLAILAVLVAMTLAAGVHYCLWGREPAREVRRRDDRLPPTRRP